MSAIQRGLRNPFRNKVRTTVALLAFGTGGFGGDKPVGAEEFSVATLEMGLLPVLQMLLLPPVTVLLLRWIGETRMS
jgi:hypothetical protein